MNRKSKIKNQKSKFVAGQAVLVAVLMLLFIAFIIAAGVTSPVTRETRIVRELNNSKIGFITAEAIEEDIAYRIRTALNYDGVEVLNLNRAVATSTVTNDVQNDSKEVATRGELGKTIREKFMELTKSDVVSFNYGVQAGNGGFRLLNSSSVQGNIYSDSSIIGAGTNLIKGDAVAATAAGLVEGVHATATARAHTINDSVIDGDAYYQVLTDTTVGGALYPESPDLPTQSFPISDDQIDEWQTAAEAGGTISSPCPYVISSDTTIGPKKINCDLQVKGSQTDVILAGMLWVVGDIDITQGVSISLDPSLGAKSVAMIGNDPADQSTKGIIILRNQMVFNGTGEPGTFVMMISRNNSAEAGGSTWAIEFQQTATGDVLLYSNHGGIRVKNNSELEQITGYKIQTENNAELIYDQGIASALFETGPGGSWNIIDWREIE